MTQSRSKLGLSQIGQIAVTVHDLVKAVEFYRDTLEAYAELSDRGVAFLRKPHRIAKLPDHELWMAFFNDVDGNILALMSEVHGK